MLIIILIVILVLSVLLTIYGFDNEENKTFGFIGILITAIVVVAIIIYGTTPEAIDVYRGKTQLEITYKGNVPIDTIVVYK